MLRTRRPLASHEGDPLIPIMNLVCMLIPLLLYGAVFVRFQTLTVKPPKIPDGPLPSQPDEELQLTVLITDQGFHFKVNPRFRQPWMASTTGGAGPDIPRRDDGWDFDELNRKLEQLKQDHRDESRIVLGAEDDVEFDVLIKAMDFSRGTDEAPLFPEVTLTRG
jgi:hypothetical protein